MTKQKNTVVDIFVVGGGVNGAGIARDAAGRGLSVTLAEKDDLASHTSSASSKLIHGGLRYLEHYEFRLVRESLKEREILLRSAPHLIFPLRFILPHHKAMRPAFLLRIGLFLYDHLGGRQLLPATITRNLTKHIAGSPLQSRFKKAFEYSDCWVDDARLVCLTAKDAEMRGANILTRHEVIKAQRQNGLWEVTLQDDQGKQSTHLARTMVNAAGAWVDDIEEKSSPNPKSKKSIRMVKGSHIIVPKLYEGPHAYTFQHTDNRVIFAIPYERNYTLIGTTDVPFSDDPNSVTINADEKSYLCSVASSYFDKPVKAQDIRWAYSGVRPLVDDGQTNASKTTRDYVLELDIQNSAPMLSVYGGKITTFRCLAEDAMAALLPYFETCSQAWTNNAKLPGGEMGYSGLADFITETRKKYGWLPEETLSRLIKAYGTYIEKLIGNAQSLEQLGKHFGAGLYEAELSYMRDEEWANTAEDALWRRSKLGLHMTEAEQKAVEDWFNK
ncbi:MAG: glycerol-3-phosphate dehydrogenase [Kordiimonas sp.]